MEHTQEQDQEGITTPLFEILVLQMSVEVKGHTWPHIKVRVVISVI